MGSDGRRARPIYESAVAQSRRRGAGMRPDLIHRPGERDFAAGSWCLCPEVPRSLLLLREPGRADRRAGPGRVRRRTECRRPASDAARRRSRARSATFALRGPARRLATAIAQRFRAASLTDRRGRVRRLVGERRDRPRQVDAAGDVGLAAGPGISSASDRSARPPASTTGSGRVVDRRNGGQRHDRCPPPQPGALVGARLLPHPLLQGRAVRAPRGRPGAASSASAMGMVSVAGDRRPAPGCGLRTSVASVCHLPPEAAQDPAQAHLQVVPLRLHQLAGRQQRAHLLRRQRLAVAPGETSRAASAGRCRAASVRSLFTGASP